MAYPVQIKSGVVGWCDGAGLTSSAGASYNLEDSRARAIALTVGASGGVWTFFIFLYPFSPLSTSLWETARYRLKYCLKEPLNLKHPTNRSQIKSSKLNFLWNNIVIQTLGESSY